MAEPLRLVTPMSEPDGEKAGVPDVFARRRAGVLLHITSLPGPADHGDLGPHAHFFLDFLADCGMSVWQVLPTGPTHADGSPYNAVSVHAGNPDLISLEALSEAGWLAADELAEVQWLGRQALRERAARAFFARAGERDFEEYRRYVAAQREWIEDYALYEALREAHGGAPWHAWPAPERDREPQAIEEARRRLSERMALRRFEQYVFAMQWRALREAANGRGILLFGDVPIFVAHDSADVWACRRCFRLDPDGSMTVVTGVPPDYFAQDGQRWGNPHYDWDWLGDHGFAWWIERLRGALAQYDMVRIDHFRGFEAAWEIPAMARTARDGAWAAAPGQALFEACARVLGALPFVAEDLGTITEDVVALRRHFGFPGMRVLQFAFTGDPANPHLPHNHSRRTVVYTGTHDNDTTIGWYAGLEASTRSIVANYLDRSGDPMPWPLIRSALASCARLAMIPMQDLLMLGSGTRMNTPGTTRGNWRWRFDWSQVHPQRAGDVRALVELYGRLL